MNYEKNRWPDESAIQYRIIKAEAEKSNKLIEAMYKYAFVDTMKLTDMVGQLLPVLLSCLEQISIRAKEAHHLRPIDPDSRRPPWVIKAIRLAAQLGSEKGGRDTVFAMIEATNRQQWPIVEAYLMQLRQEVVKLREALAEGPAPALRRERGKEDEETDNIIPFQKKKSG